MGSRSLLQGIVLTQGLNPGLLNCRQILYCHRALCSSSESESHSASSLRPHRIYSPWDSPGQNTGVGSLSLLQGIFPTQEWNWGLLHCRRILYQLSHRALSSSHEPLQSSDSATTLSPSSQESAAACWTGRQEVGRLSPLWSPGPGGCEKHRLHRKQTSWTNPHICWRPHYVPTLHCKNATGLCFLIRRMGDPCSLQGHCEDDKPCSLVLLLGFPKRLQRSSRMLTPPGQAF